jgi:hypothetical protein
MQRRPRVARARLRASDSAIPASTFAGSSIQSMWLPAGRLMRVPFGKRWKAIQERAARIKFARCRAPLMRRVLAGYTIPAENRLAIFLL